jgi:RHS repeat-associated protein
MTYDGTQAYTYDAWNRLVKVAHAYRDSNGDVQKGSTFDTMAYDGLGRRISQNVTGEGSANDLTTHYYYSTANQIMEERNGSDQTLKQQVWGVQYVDELVQEGINSNPSTDQTADTTYTVLQDANFNVTGIVNSNGTLVERYQYDAYGARTAYVNGGSNDAGLNLSSSQAARVVVGGVAQAYDIMDFGSQGLLHDGATGLIYNRACYRSTELDRFMSQDPMGYVDGLNDYALEVDNPINGLDPSGLIDLTTIVPATPSPSITLATAQQFQSIATDRANYYNGQIATAGLDSDGMPPDGSGGVPGREKLAAAQRAMLNAANGWANTAQAYAAVVAKLSQDGEKLKAWLVKHPDAKSGPYDPGRPSVSPPGYQDPAVNFADNPSGTLERPWSSALFDVGNAIANNQSSRGGPTNVPPVAGTNVNSGNPKRDDGGKAAAAAANAALRGIDEALNGISTVKFQTWTHGNDCSGVIMKDQSGILLTPAQTAMVLERWLDYHKVKTILGI